MYQRLLTSPSKSIQNRFFRRPVGPSNRKMSTFDLKITTFNILAPCYKRVQGKTPMGFRRMRESDFDQQWQNRAQRLCKYIEADLGSSDIICLQEYWFVKKFHQIFQNTLGNVYDFCFQKRTGSKNDGLAFFIKRDKLRLLGYQGKSLHEVGNRVALLLHLQLLQPPSGNASPATSSTGRLHATSIGSAPQSPGSVTLMRGPRAGAAAGPAAGGPSFLLLNTHLSFPHCDKDRDIQRVQVKELAHLMEGYLSELHHAHQHHLQERELQLQLGTQGQQLQRLHLDSLMAPSPMAAGYGPSFANSPPAGTASTRGSFSRASFSRASTGLLSSRRRTRTQPTSGPSSSRQKSLARPQHHLVKEINSQPLQIERAPISDPIESLVMDHQQQSQNQTQTTLLRRSFSKSNSTNLAPVTVNCANSSGIGNAASAPMPCCHVVVGDFNVEDDDPALVYLTTKQKFTSTLKGVLGKGPQQQFVSHKNHRGEEVGVDHVLLRLPKNSTSTTTTAVAELAPDSTVSRTIQTPLPLEDDQANQAPKTSSGRPRPFRKLVPDTYDVKVVSAALLPQQMDVARWSEDFDLLSDHRPVTTTLRFSAQA